MSEEYGSDHGYEEYGSNSGYEENGSDSASQELADAKAREKEKEKKRQEMEHLYYMVRQRLDQELGMQKGCDAAAMITMTMDALGEIHETTKTVVRDVIKGRDDKEETREEAEEAEAENTPAHRMKLKSELKALKLADAAMAADYEKELGHKEYLAVECAECLAGTGATLRNRLAAEQNKGKPDAELVAIYKQLLDAGGDGAKKNKIYETVKENREEAVKEFYMNPGKDGGPSRFEQLAVRSERERKIQKTLQIKTPITMDYLIEQELGAERKLHGDRPNASAALSKSASATPSRSASAAPSRSASAAPAAPSRTAAPELSMTRTLHKKSQE